MKTKVESFFWILSHFFESSKGLFILIKLLDISSKWLFKSWNWKRGEKYFKFFHYSPFSVWQVLDTDVCSHACVFLTNESENNHTTLYFQRDKKNCTLGKIPEKFLFKVTTFNFCLFWSKSTRPLGRVWQTSKTQETTWFGFAFKCQKSNANIPQLALIATIRQFLFSSIVCALNPFWDISDWREGSKAAQAGC